MSPRISMITLGVRDLEIAINFYERGLGFPKKKILSRYRLFHFEWDLASSIQLGCFRQRCGS